MSKDMNTTSNDRPAKRLKARQGNARNYWAIVSFVLLAAEFAQAGAADPNAEERQKAGRVTLVIGEVRAQNAQGETRALKRGDAIYVNETIETAEGGHVHLRFIDDGVVSVRPNSRLNIEQYRYDRTEPGNSAIRFNLQTGVVRSVSGKATEAAHHRFRLNTPITAIGVLGTDFVVRAETDKMWAGVYSGAIGVAPLGEGCAANDFGVCSGAKHVSEAMGSIMFERRGKHIIDRLLPQDENLMPQTDAKDVKKSDAQPLTSSATGRMSVDELKGVDVATQLNEAGDSVPPPPPTPEPISQSPFAWGRWGGQWPMDNISQDYSEAREGRKVTIGNRYFALYRDASSLTELEPRAGVYDFKLSQGQVHFVGNGVSWAPTPQPARLDAATLQIDFGQRQFNTHLQMSHERAGSATLDLSGAIQNNGLFVAQQAGGKVAGALSADGDHAGMLFEREVQAGTFHGITDWIKNR